MWFLRGPFPDPIGRSSPVICREQESCQITFDRKSFNSLTYSKMIDQNARTQCSLAGLLCPKANESTLRGGIQHTALTSLLRGRHRSSRHYPRGLSGPKAETSGDWGSAPSAAPLRHTSRMALKSHCLKTSDWLVWCDV